MSNEMTNPLPRCLRNLSYGKSKLELIYKVEFRVIKEELRNEVLENTLRNKITQFHTIVMIVYVIR